MCCWKVHSVICLFRWSCKAALLTPACCRDGLSWHGPCLGAGSAWSLLHRRSAASGHSWKQRQADHRIVITSPIQTCISNLVRKKQPTARRRFCRALFRGQGNQWQPAPTCYAALQNCTTRSRPDRALVALRAHLTHQLLTLPRRRSHTMPPRRQAVWPPLTPDSDCIAARTRSRTPNGAHLARVRTFALPSEHAVAGRSVLTDLAARPLLRLCCAYQHCFSFNSVCAGAWNLLTTQAAVLCSRRGSKPLAAHHCFADTSPPVQCSSERAA